MSKPLKTEFFSSTSYLQAARVVKSRRRVKLCLVHGWGGFPTGDIKYWRIVWSIFRNTFQLFSPGTAKEIFITWWFWICAHCSLNLPAVGRGWMDVWWLGRRGKQRVKGKLFSPRPGRMWLRGKWIIKPNHNFLSLFIEFFATCSRMKLHSADARTLRRREHVRPRRFFFFLRLLASQNDLHQPPGGTKRTIFIGFVSEALHAVHFTHSSPSDPHSTNSTRFIME